MAIVVISLFISVLIVLIYKLVTNQDEMKRLKEEQKEYQQKLKSLRNNPEEMMKVQKEAMKKNMAYMKHSFKPTLITFIPILLIFGWMNAHLAYEPIVPGGSYSLTAFFAEGVVGEAELIVDDNEKIEITSEVRQEVNSQVTWNFKAKGEGEHYLTVKKGNDEQAKKILVTNELAYEEPISVYQHSDIKKIQIGYNKLRPAGTQFSMFGWQPGWLGWYILFSLVFSLGLRKILKVY